MNDIFHEPRALYYFRHVSGALDVAISTADGWRMTLLPDTQEVRRLIKKKVLSASDIERVAGLTSRVKIDSTTCCVEGCDNPSDGVDRGLPLCEDCWTEHSYMSEVMSERFYEPPEVNLDDKDPYGLLFG